VYSFVTHQEEWHTLFIAYDVVAVEVGNSDYDAALEIHALGSAGDVYIFDGTTRVLDAILPANGSSLRLASPYVEVGTKGGLLRGYAFDGTSYTEIGSIPVANDDVDGFTIAPDSLLWVGAEGKLRLYDDFGTSLVWSSESYGVPFGTHVVLANPRQKVPVAAGRQGLIGFRWTR
jgi:hypothetical protein